MAENFSALCNLISNARSSISVQPMHIRDSQNILNPLISYTQCFQTKTFTKPFQHLFHLSPTLSHLHPLHVIFIHYKSRIAIAVHGLQWINIMLINSALKGDIILPVKTRRIKASTSTSVRMFSCEPTLMEG